MDEIREYNIDKKGGILNLFDILTIDEIKSLLKSNRFSWADRSMFKFYLGDRTIKELLPVIAMVGIAYAVRKILNEVD